MSNKIRIRNLREYQEAWDDWTVPEGIEADQDCLDCAGSGWKADWDYRPIDVVCDCVIKNLENE